MERVVKMLCEKYYDNNIYMLYQLYAGASMNNERVLRDAMVTNPERAMMLRDRKTRGRRRHNNIQRTYFHILGIMIRRSKQNERNS